MCCGLFEFDPEGMFEILRMTLSNAGVGRSGPSERSVGIQGSSHREVVSSYNDFLALFAHIDKRR